MAEHTKGEWVAHVFETHYVLTAVQGTWSVLLAVVNRDPVVLPETWEMHKANAHLLAAAPDLLEACEVADKALAPLNADVDLTVYDAEAVRKAVALIHAAIAKATGTT